MGLFRRDAADWPQGRATVLDEHGVDPVKLYLEVQLPHAAPSRVRIETSVPPGLAGTLTGQVLPVRVHPRKRDRVEVLWEGETGPTGTAAQEPGLTYQAAEDGTSVAMVSVVNSRERLGKRTATGQAVILSIGEPLLHAADLLLVELGLRLLVAGSNPREVSHRTMVPASTLERLAVGSYVPVTVDRDDPDRLMLSLG